MALQKINVLKRMTKEEEEGRKKSLNALVGGMILGVSVPGSMIPHGHSDDSSDESVDVSEDDQSEGREHFTHTFYTFFSSVSRNGVTFLPLRFFSKN